MHRHTGGALQGHASRRSQASQETGAPCRTHGPAAYPMALRACSRLAVAHHRQYQGCYHYQVAAAGPAG